MSDLVPIRRGDRAPARREDVQRSGPDQRPGPEPRRDLLPADPFADFDQMWDRMVSRFFAPWGGSIRGGSIWGQDWAPPVDIEETSDAWIFEVDLPGARREDLRVDVRDRELAISGQIRDRERAGVLRHRGRHTGTFGYRTTLPAGVDPQRVTARFDGGVLTVQVPRPEGSQPHRITIE